MDPSKALGSLDLLPDTALALLASSWPTIDAHASRSSLQQQISRQLEQTELNPTLSPSLLPRLPVALFGSSVTRYQGNIYVYGGRSSSDTASSGVRSHLYCFDTQQQKWHTCQQYNNPQPRRWHTAAVYGDCMYIYGAQTMLGGQEWDESRGEWEASSTISAYNFTTYRWSEAAQAGCGPSAKLKRSATAAGGTLYVLPAGQTGSPSFNMLHCFDLDSCCWSMRVCLAPDIPDSQHLLLEQLLHYEDSLIAVFSCNPAAATTTTAAAAATTHPDAQQQQHQQPSGSSSTQTKTLQLFSLALSDCRWHKLQTHGAAPVSRTQSCIALLGKLLLVSGGARPGAAGADQALLPDLAFLHLPSRQWQQLQLPQRCQPARACHAAAVMPGGNSICLFGGWHESWPQAAVSLQLERGYVRKPQHCTGPAAAAAATTGSSSRAVVNTELRLALLTAASDGSSSNMASSVTEHAIDQDPTNHNTSVHNNNNSRNNPNSSSSTRFSRNMPYCDVVISSADGDQFGAHRFLLASQSPVFEAMFGSGGMAEAASGAVTLPDVSSPVLEALLCYLYGGLPAGISQELVLGLFTTADRFLLPGLAAECVLLLLGCLTAENVSLVADLANTHRLQELWQACVGFTASPEVQLEVFNSAAFAQLWRDSAAEAQAFTTQVVGLTQQVVSQMKQQLPGAATDPKDLAACTLPPLQPASGAGGALPGKRQRTE